MKFILAILLFLTIPVLAQHEWVQEEAILVEEDGKTFVLRINEAQQAEDWDEVIDLCDELMETLKKAANKVKTLTFKGDALKELNEPKEAFETYQAAIDRYPMYMKYSDAVKKQLVIADAEYAKIKVPQQVSLPAPSPGSR